MQKHVNLFSFVKVCCLVTYLLSIPLVIFSQTNLVKGVVKDEQSLKTIPGVNIKIYGTKTGTFTDNSGNFFLKINKLPSTLVITCVGYETGYYEMKYLSKSPIEFLLSPKSYQLQEIEVNSKKNSFLFKEKNYSVLDYELMGGDILLLVFRYQLKRSELVLLTQNGDTLAISKLPKVLPASLYKDFLSKVHYFTKSNDAYQCYYNEPGKSIEFLYKTKVDSLMNHVEPFIFRMSDRLYFQESLANGFGTAIGFYGQGAGKKYIRQCFNEKKASEFRDDQKFYVSWNNFAKNGRYDEYEARAHQIEYFNMIYPVIKIGENNIAFFNFSSEEIEMMNENGEIIRTVPITFQLKTDSGWRWGNTILTDDYNHNVYAVFLRNGMVKVRKIDLETGKLDKGTVLSFPFPLKIEIYQGEVYFLNKDEGTDEKWNLCKCSL